jgi:hypothetical protein
MVRIAIFSQHTGVQMLRQHRSKSQYTFLICAFPYTHRSSGVRALYRLCHHLNQCGFASAILLRKKPLWFRVCRYIYYFLFRHKQPKGKQADIPSSWNVPFHKGAIGDSIIIYPEVVSGNPYRSKKVIRWVLNDPGLLGGDKAYPDSEMIFIYDFQKINIVNQSVSTPLTQERILWLGLIDPDCIYPDPSVPKSIDSSFTHKGHALKKHFPFPSDTSIISLEKITPNMHALGDALRRTRTLYSYDHYSNVLREAAICGCELRVMGENGVWHDPLTCQCPNNIFWSADFKETYATNFHDSSFIHRFIQEVRTRWPIS